MIRIRPAVPIAQQTVVADLVRVRSRLALDRRGRRDAQRGIPKHRRLEDPLRAPERGTSAFETEPASEHIARKNIAVEQALLAEVSKRCRADASVEFFNGCRQRWRL